MVETGKMRRKQGGEEELEVAYFTKAINPEFSIEYFRRHDL